MSSASLASRVAFPGRCDGTAAVVVACTVGLTACQGTDDLGHAGCLPLRVPATVVLQRETGLHRIGDEETPVLSDHPRDTRNDASRRSSLLRPVPAGTRVSIDRLTQRWGFDASAGALAQSALFVARPAIALSVSDRPAKDAQLLFAPG